MARGAVGKVYIVFPLITIPMSAIAALAYVSFSFVQYELKKQAATLPPVPPVSHINSVGRGTVILDRNGLVADHFATSDQIGVSLKTLPAIVPNAFIAAEDQNFWKHDGVDFEALFRAAISQFKGGRGTSGGSTITEQLAKNIAIGNAHTWQRKIREALFARRLERAWGKEAILGTYLNTVYLGEGAYGVEAASQTWFGKHASELEPYEAAFLGGLPKAPSDLNPVFHQKRAHARRQYVLGRMCVLGMIDCSRLAEYNAKPLPEPKKAHSNGVGSSWFDEAVRRKMIARYGAEKVYGEMDTSLNVRTGQDRILSDTAYRELLEGLIQYEHRHGLPDTDGMLPSSPDWIRDTVGSCERRRCQTQSGRDVFYPYVGHRPEAGTPVWLRPVPSKPDEMEVVRPPAVQGSVLIADRNSGNIVADIGGLGSPGGYDRNIQSWRQPGSIAKIAVTWLALENGYLPDTPVLDVPISVDVNGGRDRWTPGGDGMDDGMGVISFEKAFDESRNQAYVRIANDIGWDAISAIWKDVGLYSKPNVPMAAILGGFETRPVDVMEMLGRVLTGNMQWHPFFIQSITDGAGKVDLENHIDPLPKDDKQQAERADRVKKMEDMLKSVVAHGTAIRPFSGMDISEIGGKTGTSNDVRDSWFAGFFKDKVIVVHIGYDNGKGLGEHEFGSTIAAPIAAAIIKRSSSGN